MSDPRARAEREAQTGRGMAGWSEEERREALAWSREQWREYRRATRDLAPATAPPPLVLELALDAGFLTLRTLADRRGWPGWLAFVAMTALVPLLWLRDPLGRARARRAGVRHRRDEPKVPTTFTWPYAALRIAVALVVRITGHGPRRQTAEQSVAESLARDLVRRYAWWRAGLIGPGAARRRRAGPPV